MKQTLTCIVLIVLLPFLQSSKPNSINIYKNKVDSISVSKRLKIMRLYVGKKWVVSYSVSLGQNSKGHKQYQGDNRTPEGKYYITDRNPNSSYFLNLHISYPNNKDRAYAKRLGKPPGGDIKIHGYSDRNGNTKPMDVKFAYTWGCIAVNNNDMKEIYSLVKTGAVIVINP
jgi:murein L,D-transpeptidase YafK